MSGQLKSESKRLLFRTKKLHSLISNNLSIFPLFKTTDGAAKDGVIEGVCPATITPDVTVSTTTEHLLMMFNREVDAINMIVEGHVKVTGEFDKALSLKEVLIAAREAESH